MDRGTPPTAIDGVRRFADRFFGTDDSFVVPGAHIGGRISCDDFGGCVTHFDIPSGDPMLRMLVDPEKTSPIERAADATRKFIDTATIPFAALGAAEAAALRSSAAALIEEITGVQANRLAGNAFRDEIAQTLRSAGRDVVTEVYKSTPFGRRFIDLEVSGHGQVLGGIETKLGSSPYTPAQRAKDSWLWLMDGYRVDLVRKP